MAFNKIDPKAYDNRAYTIFIWHPSGNTNKNSAIVYKWHNEAKRLYMFAKAKYLIENYRGEPIKGVHFYDPRDTRQKKEPVGGRDEHGTYWGEMEFMNQLRAIP